MEATVLSSNVITVAVPVLFESMTVGGLHTGVVSGQKNPLWMRCAERVRSRIDASGIARMDLAALTDIGLTTLLYAEDGERIPRLRTLERIADVLGISPVWLAYGDEGGLRFRQKRPKPDPLPDPPVPHPDNRPPVDRWRGVGERLSSARTMRQLTLRGVATAAGLSPQAILLIERGESEPRISTVEEIAVALDVAPGWLAYGEGEGPTVA